MDRQASPGNKNKSVKFRLAIPDEKAGRVKLIRSWFELSLSWDFPLKGWKEEKEWIDDPKLQKSKLAIPDQRAGPIKPSDRSVIRARWRSKESQSTADWILLLEPAEPKISLDFYFFPVKLNEQRGILLHLRNIFWQCIVVISGV